MSILLKRTKIADAKPWELIDSVQTPPWFSKDLDPVKWVPIQTRRLEVYDSVRIPRYRRNSMFAIEYH